MFWSKKEPGFYETEMKRIQEQIKGTAIGTEKYDDLINEMTRIQSIGIKEKESKQLLDKQELGGIIGKIVGFIGLGAIVVTTILFEKKGNVFSGSSLSGIKSAFTIGTKLYS